MRLLIFVLSVLLMAGLLGFVLTNFDTTVSVQLFNTTYTDVNIFYVVLGSVLVGIVFVAIIAMAEGATIRLENRRLKREIHKLETENNYLRTQPPATKTGGATPDRPDERKPKPALAPAPGAQPPSAPVYESREERRDTDPDDDMYTGGRAV